MASTGLLCSPIGMSWPMAQKVIHTGMPVVHSLDVPLGFEHVGLDAQEGPL